MRRVWSVLLMILSLALSFSLISCGEEGSSSQVEITITPDSPLVSQSDFTVIGADFQPVTIQGPWFGFSYTITNGADRPLIVQDFELEIITRVEGGTLTNNYFPNFGLFSASRTRITEEAIQPGATFPEEEVWPVENLPELSSFRYRCRITFVGYFETVDDEETEDEDEGGLPGERFQRTLTFTTR